MYKRQAIKRDFGGEAPKVLKMIAEADKEALAEALEAEGRVSLGPYTLTAEHLAVSRTKREIKGKHIIPHVVEPSFGLDRLVYVTLEHAYTVKEGRVVLRLPRDVAPIQVAVLPLVSRDGLPERAREIYDLLLSEGFDVEYDEAGSIGRRYARCDEIGAVSYTHLTLPTTERV